MCCTVSVDSFVKTNDVFRQKKNGGLEFKIYEDVSERALNMYTKRARNLLDVFSYVNVRWQTYARVTESFKIFFI